jgi:hypothetical protein
MPRQRFTPGKGPPVPIGQVAGWTSEVVWAQRLEEKSLASTRDPTPVVQSVVRHYTDTVIFYIVLTLVLFAGLE